MTTQRNSDRAGPSVADVPVACTLDSGDVPRRIKDWNELLAHVTDRSPLSEGIRLTFDPGTGAGDVARLAAAEQACCAFFQFAVTIDDRGLALEVRSPEQAGELVTALFGAAGT